jgi:hypothetical protein
LKKRERKAEAQFEGAPRSSAELSKSKEVPQGEFSCIRTTHKLNEKSPWSMCFNVETDGLELMNKLPFQGKNPAKKVKENLLINLE